MDKKEIRNFNSKFEVRAADDGEENKIVGYALKFNTFSEDLGGFIESIDPGALAKCDMSDVRCLIDHDPQKILGRTSNGTLKLTIDDIGLRYECIPSNTTYANDLMVNMRDGNIDKCSFGFVLNYTNGDCDTWEYDENRDLYIRTLKDIKLLTDVSVVTYPAYKNTECVVAKRKLENLKNDLETRNLKTKLEMELELI